MLWKSKHSFRIAFIFLCLGVISGIVFNWEAGAEIVSTSVTVSVCGNGTIEGNEECDDGNIVSGDGCSSTCQTEVVEERRGGGIRPTPYAEIVYYTRVILEGRAYPNALVNILKDGQFLTTAIADSRADFRVEIRDITPGIYTFGLWAEDKNGLKSPTFTITFYVAPAVTTTVSGILLPPTISLSSASLFKGETLKIFGQSAPENRVEIFIYKGIFLKEILNISAIADFGGDWYYLFDTADFGQEIYKVKAKATTKEGLLSIFSKILELKVELVVPPEPPVPPIPPIPPIEHPYPGGDLNKDDRVNFIDFSILLYWWGRYNECADQNQDGIVNLIDFSIMLYYWTG